MKVYSKEETPIAIMALEAYQKVVETAYLDPPFNDFELADRGLGDTLLVFVIREVSDAETVPEAVQMLRKAAQELMETADIMEEKL